MKKKERAIILGDLDSILDISFKYCKHDNKKICDAAQKINNEAYATMKYIDRYVRAKKRKNAKLKK
jgi:thiamine pyrophosphokinase